MPPRTIAIRKKGPKFDAEDFLSAVLAPSGEIAAQIGAVVPGVVPLLTRAATSPSGSLATSVSGPSLVIVPKLLSGIVTPTSGISSTTIPTPLDTYTAAVGGSITPAGALVTGIDPATVRILKSLAGQVAPNGAVLLQVVNIIVTKLSTAQVAPAGALATLAGGPSLVTIAASVAGTITPGASVSNSVTVPPGTIVSQSVSGTVTPAGSATSVIDPFTVVLLKSVSGTITPASAVAFFSTGTLTKVVGGVIVPYAAVVNVSGGPSYITVPKALVGSITPVGTRSAIVIAPPLNTLSIGGTITPTSALTKSVSGPSFVTVPKSVQALVQPIGNATSVRGGPSFVTVPKAMSGGQTMFGDLTYVVKGPSNVIVPQAVSGGITPLGSVTSLAIGGPPISTAPMYVTMGNWDLGDFDTAPQWPAILFTGLLASDSVTKWANTFAGMRTRGMKGGPSITKKADYCDGSAPNYVPNFTKYKALVNIITSVPNIASYIAGGECSMFDVADEPYHPDFGGNFTPALQKQFAQYVKTALPGIKTWFRQPFEKMSGSLLPSGGWAGSVDYCEAQYFGPNHQSASGGGTVGQTPFQCFRDQLIGAKNIGISLICGGNWWNGGDGSSGIQAPGTVCDGRPNLWVMTPAEIRACIDGALQAMQNEPGPQWFMYWTNAIGSSLGCANITEPLQTRSDYAAAFKYAKDSGLARGASAPPIVYNTCTTQVPAPYPPRAIAVGAGVRDPDFDHKVFHLLDNARLQTAEYPALSSDNSTLYFVRGGAGTLGSVVWNTQISQVQVGTVRSAFDAGFAGVVDGVIWDRNDHRFMYYLAGVAPLRIFRKNINAATVVVKDLTIDPSFAGMWGAQATALLGSGLHSSRSQERFVGIVGSGLGVFAWDRLTNTLWNWQATGGKVVSRVTIDDISQFVKITFNDSSWKILTLGALGTYTESAIFSESDPPLREDSQTNKMWQAAGIGVKSRAFSPDAGWTVVYTYPKRLGKINVYQKGMVSLQAVDEIVYVSTTYAATITTPWVQHNGEVYKVNWATEQVSAANKLDPEVVRQGVTILTKVASLAALTARGQWFYDLKTSILYVRCTDGLSPTSKRMVVFDWRFGMEEVMMITTAGVLKGRLCHHYSHVSDPAVDVDAARGAAVSYDGSRALFTSNWGGSPTLGIYAVMTDPNA